MHGPYVFVPEGLEGVCTVRMSLIWKVWKDRAAGILDVWKGAMFGGFRYRMCICLEGFATGCEFSAPLPFLVSPLAPISCSLFSFAQPFARPFPPPSYLPPFRRSRPASRSLYIDVCVLIAPGRAQRPARDFGRPVSLALGIDSTTFTF